MKNYGQRQTCLNFEIQKCHVNWDGGSTKLYPLDKFLSFRFLMHQLKFIVEIYSTHKITQRRQLRDNQFTTKAPGY